MSEEKDECIIATEVSSVGFGQAFRRPDVHLTAFFCSPAGVTSHRPAARCSFALWESFYTPSDAALTPGGGVPP